GYVDDVYGADFFHQTGDPIDTGFYFPPNIRSNAPVYHGTAMAGIIGAVGNNGLGTAGLNWSVRIIGLQGFTGDNTDPALRFSANKAVARAWQYLLEMKRRGVNIRVVSDSTGGTPVSREAQNSVAIAAELGILTVTSAGNDGINKDTFSPEYHLAPMLSVGASTESDLLAVFSN